jgi:hypothetical protein
VAIGASNRNRVGEAAFRIGSGLERQANRS